MAHEGAGYVPELCVSFHARKDEAPVSGLRTGRGLTLFSGPAGYCRAPACPGRGRTSLRRNTGRTPVRPLGQYSRAGDTHGQQRPAEGVTRRTLVRFWALWVLGEGSDSYVFDRVW